jgi:hypothetical protein
VLDASVRLLSLLDCPFRSGFPGTVQYTSAVETLDGLRVVIDAHLFADALKQLQQRTWLLHWANFVFWSLPSDGPQKFLDLVLQDGFTIALQINAPHLLRCGPPSRSLGMRVAEH